MKRRPLFPALVPRRLRRGAALGAPPEVAGLSTGSPGRVVVLLVLLALGAALGTGLYESARRLVGVAPQISASELAQLRAENQRLIADNERLQGSLAASESRLAIERAAKDQLAADLRAAQKEMGDMRNDLAFFDQLIPMDPRQAQVSIRSAELERQGALLRYRVLLMRGGRPSGEFTGRLQFSASGTRAGTAATIDLHPFLVSAEAGEAESASAPAAAPSLADPLALRFRQYQRAEGTLEVPAGFVVRSVTVRVVEGGVVRSQSTVNLPA
ncbi:hypothetical protein CDO44_18310 [Pigmentiphaga sp. NML080357]|uniref:DUF6776 family protein n=1 Tax=Pigmentiphaga sp. NML080357 TaxID=2008675 RepID=UPI000B40DC9B|nr:DUF6776 family protein [Pigmentiphaga sp. NML080357]OVZ57358.1 hypothetical protein CDO44_18310 [Pigmentiphaga sp. NML080357]